MAKKKSNLELASISLSELMNRLGQYKAEFVECREDEARRKELLSRIGEIEKEILKRQKGKGEESAQQSKQQTEQNEASQKAPFNVNMTVQIGSILAVIVLAAVRFQVVREILIGFSLLVLTFGTLSLIIGWLITRITQGRLLKAASYTFLTLCVFWVLGTLMQLPEYFQGNVYWANQCLCFVETEEVLTKKLVKEAEYSLFSEIPLVSQEFIVPAVEHVDLKKQSVILYPVQHIAGKKYDNDRIDWSLERVRDGMLKLFKKYPELQVLTITIRGLVWDRYRREEIGNIVTIKLTRYQAEQIQWHNFSREEWQLLLRQEGSLIWHVSKFHLDRP